MVVSCTGLFRENLSTYRKVCKERGRMNPLAPRQVASHCYRERGWTWTLPQARCASKPFVQAQKRSCGLDWSCEELLGGGGLFLRDAKFRPAMGEGLHWSMLIACARQRQLESLTNLYDMLCGLALPEESNLQRILRRVCRLARVRHLSWMSSCLFFA